MITVADLVAARLRAGGVQRVFGRSVPGIAHIGDVDESLAELLADADGRLGPGPGVAYAPDGRLRVSSRPGGNAAPVRASTPSELVAALDAAIATARGPIPATAVVQLDLSLDAPVDVPSGSTPQARREPDPVPDIDSPRRPVVLAGPGVVRTGHVEGLRALAASGNLGVANTWGAKGVFRWDSPHHLGTAGLQARDFELLGFADAGCIVATGIDPDESSVARFGLAPVIDAQPGVLGALAARVPRAPGPIPATDLYTRLAAVAQPGYVADTVPLHPARAIADLRAVLGDDGIVTADPGWTGLWVARTFPTVELGSVVVPATVAPGIGVALAIAARLRGKHAVAVTTSPLDAPTRALVAFAERSGLDLVVSAWGEGGELPTADDHVALAAAALTSPGVTVFETPVDAAYTDLLVEAAGPVVAWSRPSR